MTTTKLEINYLPPYNLEILNSIEILKELTQEYAISFGKMLVMYKYNSFYVPLPKFPAFRGAEILLESYCCLLNSLLSEDPLNDTNNSGISNQEIAKCTQEFKDDFLNKAFVKDNSNENIISQVNSGLARLFYRVTQSLIAHNIPEDL